MKFLLYDIRVKNNFIKMQGLGNDFIVLKGPINMTAEKVAELCNRQSGIGADGLLVVIPKSQDKVVMRYWNADGSEAEMCGNGLRCATRYAVDNKFVEPGEFTVNTTIGPLKAIWNGQDENQIEVQVGKVSFDKTPLVLHGFSFYKAKVGNPHAIAYVEDVDLAPVAEIGPKVENDSHFPNKTNVEFVQTLSQNKIKMRFWERGVGETMACGTGMVAAALVTSRLKGLVFPIEVLVLGGHAKIWLDNEGFCRMLAPACVVSKGHL